jgi:tetratricopeptide (TPR) repeat protein
MTKQKSRHVDSAQAVGRRIHDLRVAAGLKQRDLSFPGCSPAYISHVESGARTPSLQVLEELGRRLGVSAEFLARGSAPTAEEFALADAQLAQRLDHISEARTAFEDLGHTTNSGVRKAALLGLGQIALNDGRPDRAIEFLEAHEAVPPRTPVDPAAVEALTDAYWLLGERTRALELLEERLEDAREDPVASFRIAVFYANALIDTGRFDDAARLLLESERSLGPTPDPLSLARVLWAQSRMQVARGASDVAARYAEDALAIIKGTEHVEYAARAKQLIAFIELERGNGERALELLDEAAPLIEATGDRPAIAKYHVERARALAAVGQTDEARSVAEELVRETDALGRVDAARALAVIAGVFAAAGDRPRAIDLYAAAADALSDLEHAPMLVSVYAEWSDALKEEGRTDEALEVARRGISARLGSPQTR